MSEKKNEIRDDEFRVIGHTPIQDTEAQNKRRRNLGVAIVTAVLVISIGILAIIFWPKEQPEDPNDGLFENIPDVVAPISAKPLGIETDATFTEKLDTVINDVQLSIYIPHNATPVLTVGNPNAEARKAFWHFRRPISVKITAKFWAHLF